MATLHETNFTNLPGQTGEVYRGKVGDTYTLEHGDTELLAVVRTDRISAYDVVLPETIPHKGQVLNQLSANLLEATAKGADGIPNWLIETPDPNVSLGYKASPFRLEMIMRGYLLGSAWKAYSEEGMRDLTGNRLPQNMREFQRFDAPLLTPTTKADEGHDENISPAEIVTQGLATEKELYDMTTMSHVLFIRGVAAAAKRGLVLADTKYEFGKLPSGQIIVIDEVHTPDSSRYFPEEEFEAYRQDKTDQRPQQMSKEFVREWLKNRGFTGQEGQTPPAMPEDVRSDVSQRYIDLYETMSGRKFEPAGADMSEDELEERIRTNIIRSLAELSL
jgi:phosphoribosylaminoimidazole-succinocarboxamide synthase